MSMTRQIPSVDWQNYFDRFTRDQLGDNIDPPKAATIEVISMQLGDQYEALTTRLLGLVYDPRRDAFEIQLEDISHLVNCPAEIWVVEEENGFVSSLELMCRDGTKEIIYVRRSGPPARVGD